MKRAIVIGAAALLVVACSSKKTTWYESKVQLLRVENIRFDDKGKAEDCDVEFEWTECPGDQKETIRGDAAFAECMKQYKAGEEVKVKIEYHWDKAGFMDWDVHEFGGCKRPPDPDDLSSFDTVQECEPIISNGVKEGFRCNRIPQKELLKKCPWFARH